MNKLEIPGPAKRYPQQVLIEKINEVVDEVNELRAELEKLKRVKANRTITYGAPRGDKTS